MDTKDEKVEKVRVAWNPPDGLWDADCMLPGTGSEPGELDPYVPTKEEFDRAHWRAIIDAEGDLICLAPRSGPLGEPEWPEKLVEFLNATTDLFFSH